MSTWEHIVQTLALHCRSYLKRISLLLFLLLQGMNAHCSESGAGAITSPLAKTRDFWVWDLNIMPPGFRRASATLRAEGKRSLIYVEDNYYGKEISPEFIQRLKLQLEEKMPSGSLEPDTGIISFEEKLFGSLPTKITRDDRLIVLFADLGKFKDTQFDGFFNAFDQMPDAEAFKEFGQHSNEANVIYLNGFRVSESYTVGVIAHELHHLLASTSGVERENWLSESLAEGAMLLTGYYGDQGHVNHFVENTWNISLVSPRYVQYGPQLLFSAFLLDSLPSAPGSAIGELTHMKIGRAHV